MKRHSMLLYKTSLLILNESNHKNTKGLQKIPAPPWLSTMKKNVWRGDHTSSIIMKKNEVKGYPTVHTPISEN